MSAQPGPVSRLWFRWKSLQLPWRRQRLIGYDLDGNTFWEFKDSLNSNRMRRIVRHTQKVHHADVKITPQWHQWLRHTRLEAPSIQEQQYELMRQTRVKQLATQADARWASKPSFLDAPAKQNTPPGISSGEENVKSSPRQATDAAAANASAEVGEATSTDKSTSRGTARAKKQPGFARPQQGAPGEGWQPQTWNPSVASKR